MSDDFIDQGEIVSTRARHPEDSQRWDAKGGDIIRGAAAGGADQRRLGLVVARSSPARCRTTTARCCWAPRSFGKGSVQTVIPLPGNGAMRLTTARYYTPSGRSIQGLGITPDVQGGGDARGRSRISGRSARRT